MLFLVLCFFFYYYADRRDLHSFPTRRSSDLGMREELGADEARAIGREHVEHAGGQAGIPGDLGDGERGQRRGRRSEEHTSELQSRRDLVCRLLLEKKKRKKKKKQHTLEVHEH